MRALMRTRLGLVIAVIAALAIVVIVAGSAAAGGTPGRAGVLTYNAPVCGSGYIPVSLGRGNYFNVYNAQDQNTCVQAERHHLSWSVTSWTPPLHNWQMPVISSGWKWGRYSCYDGRSAYPGHGSQCMRYPVREDQDGTPWSSVEYWPHLASGNVAYDIWFSQASGIPVMQNDGTEVMIWLAHPGICLCSYHVWYYTWIEGREYAVIHWIPGNARTGGTWNYVAYIALRQTRFFSGWLNPFFRDTIRHGWLLPSWYLTAIDFGTEINQPDPGRHGQYFAVTRYALTGVR